MKKGMDDRRNLQYALIGVYALCFALRGLEYFVLRTDETFWGEAFLHKLAGIAVLYAAAKRYGFSAREIGFARGRAVRKLLAGLGFGTVVFALAYFVEIAMLAARQQFTAVRIYVSAYAPGGNIGNQTAPVFFLICIQGNAVNVIMEEGVFRGLFPRMLEKRYSFFTGAVISAALFGVWHIAAPLRSFLDGEAELHAFAANALMLVVTSALIGLKFSMLARLTGSLYMGMGDHFVNNTLVNMIHVLSRTGADEWQVLRIALAQSVSFAVVLACYVCRNRKQKAGGTTGQS